MMGIGSVENLKRAFEHIQQFYSPPRDGNQDTIDIAAFVQILFQVAYEREEFSGKWGEDNRLHIQIGVETPIIYDFAKGTFRTILAAIANFARLQNPSRLESEKFNFYGDNQEVSRQANGGTERFQVETLNNNGKPYFVIRKL